jgi:RHS repeat-associated protein
MRNALWILALALALAPIPADAQRGLPPTTKSHFVAHPTPFEEAHRAALEARSRAPVARQSSSTATPPEIVEMARALQNDPDLIYQYVHDNIQFSPLYGYLKGPVGTLLDGRGDAFDQCSLMVALLNQAALSNPSISNVNFEVGQIHLTSPQLQSWLGVDSNYESISGLLGSGGFPGVTYTDGSAGVGHVWVQVSINGTAYVFDPAFKTQTWKTGKVSSLAGIMGYSQAQFLADAGGTVMPTSIQGVNRNALRSDLTTYAGKLATYVRANLPTGSVSDLVGGGTIVPTPFSNGQTVRQTSNPNLDSTVPVTVTATIPSEYYATLSIQIPGAATQTFNSSDIYGHRLSLFFNASYVPTLYLDGAAQVSGSAQVQGDSMEVDESTSLPFAPFAETQQPIQQFVTVATNAGTGSAGYVISTGWDQVGRGMVEKHQALLRQAINSGAAANSELVLGEAAAMQGYLWLAECAAQQHLSDQLLGTATQYFYGGGIAGEAVGPDIASPYVDLPLNFINVSARVNGTSGQSPTAMAAFLDSSGTSSSFESTSLEQSQAAVTGFTAASTVKLLDIGLQKNDTIFDINNGTASSTATTYSNTIRPQMEPYYNPNDLVTIDGYVNHGFRVIAPLHGQIAIGQWTGVGFKTMQGSADSGFSYGEIISGGLQGGFGGTDAPPVVVVGNDGKLYVIPANSPYLSMYGPPGGNGPTGGDPEDIRMGSYRYQHQDLMTGPKAFPYGLTFQRSYDSNAQATTGPLGYGWTHNNAIAASVGSDGFGAMGQSTPLSAVSSIVALYVSSDLVNGQALTGQANLQQFVLETVVNHWFTDQLTNTAVYVGQGWSNEEFTLLPDGTYAPQPGSAALLDAPGGNFRYRNKAGETLTFNSSGQISSWTNTAGALVTYTYSGGQLTTVANAATGRQLTLAYNGSLVSSVSDGTRTVSYGYTNGNLTAYTDALQQNTTYNYDTSGQQDTAGHLTQIYYPSHPANAFVVNYYDGLGRIKKQTDANGNLTQSFFAGSRSQFIDGVGTSHVWYLDPLGDVTNDIQDYGPAPHLNLSIVSTYDPQRNLLTKTMPEGNSTAYTYDTLFNQLTITDTPKPGSPLPPRVMSYSHTTPIAAFPNFEEVQTFTDPGGNVTGYSYDPNTGNVLTVTQPTVTKPGAGSSAPQTTFTYTAIGLPLTSRDAEGRLSQFQYDATHADQMTSVTVDSGRLNLTRQYAYDSFGDQTSITDANGHTTTSTFDNLRRLTQTNGPIAGVRTSYTYFPDGQIKTMTRNATSSETTQYTYTLFGQVSTVTDPLGTTTTTTYDADGRIQTLTEPVSASQNRQRTYSYDALSRTLAISDTTSGSPGQALEGYTYSPNGRVSTFTDADGHVTSYTYDGFDRLSKTTYPDNSIETSQLDANGNVLQMTARSGQTITFTYDPLNRTATKSPQGESAGQVTYGYDLTGRLLQATDASSTTPYQIAYDTAGRPIGYTDQQGRNTTVGYDSVGNATRMQWPANTNGTSAYFVTYQFDALNRMTEIDENGSAAKALVKYQWDSLSRPTLITYGDATTDAFSQYDADDNPLTLALNFGGGQNNVSFSYSWLKNHQRQSATVSNAAFQYTPSQGTVNYAPANVNNGYTSVGGMNFTYDGNRNLTFDGFNTLTYDVENRVVTAQNQAIVGTAQYLYDPLNHRKQKQVNGVTTQFVLAGDQEIADFSGTGVGTAQTLTVRGVGGWPVAAITPAAGAQPETVAYYHHDPMGTTAAATQPGQSGAVQFTYSEFGIPGAADALVYQYDGYRIDSETGLYYVQTRYYSPGLGRFLQTDRLGLAGGPNLYAYAANDPLNLTDRTGEWFGWDDAIAIVGGGLVGVAGQIIGDLVTGQGLSTPANMAAAFVGGAVTAETALYLAPTMGPAGLVIAGAAGGAAGNLTSQGINLATDPNATFSPAQLAFATGVGGLTGLIPGIQSETNTLNNTLFNNLVGFARNGTLDSVTLQEAWKMFLGMGENAALGQGAVVGTVAGNAYSAFMSWMQNLINGTGGPNK